MKIEDIRRDIERGVDIALRDVKGQVMDIIAQLMMEFYREYSPSVYIRTGQLFKAIVDKGVKSRTKGGSFEIYFDSGMMAHPNPAYDKYGNEHTSEWSEDKILKYIMTGGKNGAPHGGYAPAGGKPVWFKLERELSDLDIILYASLIQAGVPVH